MKASFCSSASELAVKRRHQERAYDVLSSRNAQEQDLLLISKFLVVIKHIVFVTKAKFTTSSTLLTVTMGKPKTSAKEEVTLNK
jgi:hypothetical protein